MRVYLKRRDGGEIFGGTSPSSSIRSHRAAWWRPLVGPSKRAKRRGGDLKKGRSYSKVSLSFQQGQSFIRTRSGVSLAVEEVGPIARSVFSFLQGKM